MKIGILTFHRAINYGAVFQTFATQEYLKSLGHEAVVIDYYPKYIKYTHKPIRTNRHNRPGGKQGIRMLIHDLVSAPIRLKRNHLFNNFVKEHLNIVSWPDGVNDLDAIIFGSDQIWNTNITNGVDPIYWGCDNIFKGKKLIAYSASCGALKIAAANHESFKNLLPRFDFISVRELGLFNFLKPIVPELSLTVDPVILAGTDVFRHITKSSAVRKPYLLLFQLGHDPMARNIADRIAKERNLIVLEILSQSVSTRGTGIRNAVSPQELLGLYENCSYVVSSSFHGTIFALLYEKNFVYVQSQPIAAERVQNILAELHLAERILTNDKTSRLPDDIIDYKAISIQLASLRDSSRNYISNALT